MPRRSAVIGLLVVIVLAVAATGPGSAVAGTRDAHAQTASPLVWAAAANPPRSDADPANLTAVSCPTTGLCAAIDDNGDLLTSTDPQAGAASWAVTGIPYQFGPSSIDCPSPKLCVIGDGNGDVWHSTTPAGGYRRWVRVHLERPLNTDGFIGTACPTTGMCVVDDINGNVWATADPRGGKSAWHHSTIPYRNDSDEPSPVQCSSTSLCWVEVQLPNNREQLWETTTPVTGGWKQVSGPAPASSTPTVSCPTSGFCVRVGNNGQVATAPSRSGPWASGQINGWSPLTGVDCLGMWNCIAADSAGNVLSSKPNAALSSRSNIVPGSSDPVVWTAGHVPGQHAANGVSCPTAGLCLSGVKGGVLISHDPTGPATAWTKTTVPALKGATVTAVACPSLHLCIAATARGGVFATTTPAGPGSGWTREQQLSSLGTYGGDVAQALTFATCPSVRLCFAGTPSSAYLEGTTAGMLLSSTDPTDPHSWHRARLGFNGVSCPVKNLCVAMRQPQNYLGGDAIAYSHHPTGGKRAWTLEPFKRLAVGYSDDPAAAISCVDAHLCVAAGSDEANSMAGAVAVSTDPTVAGSWKVEDLSGSEMLGVTCTTHRTCVAWDDTGDIFFATPH